MSRGRIDPSGERRRGSYFSITAIAVILIGWGLGGLFQGWW